jgi:outer membrane protein OmpA-like peptidoglycan-associated protein
MGKIEKYFYWLCFFLAIYITIGFKLVPYVIQEQLVKNLDDNLTLKTSVEKVEFNPFIFEAKVHNLALTDEKGNKTISFSKFKLNIAVLRSILEAHVSLKEVLLQDATINIEESLDGTINLTKILKVKEKKKEEPVKNEETLDIKFLVSNISLLNMNINYTKQTDAKPYKLSINNANYILHDVGTYKNSLASNNLQFNINEHTKVAVSGAFNTLPFKMYGKAEIIDLRIKEVLEQQKEILNFDINDDARFDLALNYNINTENDFDLKLETEKLEFSNINISQNKSSIVKLNKLMIEKVNLDLLKQDIKINNININDLYTDIISDKNGLNLATLINEPITKIEVEEEIKEDQKTKITPEALKPWNILVSNFKQTNLDLTFSDKVNNTSVKTKKFNTDISSIKVTGPDILLNKLKITNPNIEYTDNKNAMNVELNNNIISLDTLSILNNNIDINNISTSQSNLSFKDKKSSLNVNLNKPKINLNSLKIKDSNIYISKINLNTPKLDFKDSKNGLDIKALDTNLTTNELNIIKSIISINKIKLDTPNLKFKDIKSKLDVDTKNTNLTVNKLNINGSKIAIASIALINPKLNINDRTNKLQIDINKINANINSFLLNNNDISIKTAELKKGLLTFKDIKNKTNISSKKMQINARNIKQSKNLLSLASLKILDPSISMVNDIDKTNILAKNIDISITGISNGKNGLKVLKTNISKPNISVILQKNTSKVESKESITKKAKTDTNNESTTKLNIGPINIDSAVLSFEDKNLPLPFVTIISKLNGNISQLDTRKSSTSKLKVNGIVDKYGTAQITGVVDPKSLKILTDINMLFKNISMQNFTPYTGKFIGKELESGKLDLDLKYNVEKSNLDAKNNIVITKLKLGEKVESKDAVSLPLELAITLLEDRNGVIDLSIPVTGNMDDPQFAIGSVVWKAFVNLITKAITAPFSLIGAIFGFEANEINSVNFAYGKDSITPIQKETLDKITQILQKRPNIVLEVVPSYDKDKDLNALKKAIFDKIVLNKLKNVNKKDYKDYYIELLEETYEDFDQKIKPLKQKYANDQKAYINTLESYIISKQEVQDSTLKELAFTRTINIKEYLVKEKKINIKQIKLSKKINIKTQSDKTSNIDLKLSK